MITERYILRGRVFVASGIFNLIAPWEPATPKTDPGTIAADEVRRMKAPPQRCVQLRMGFQI